MTRCEFGDVVLVPFPFTDQLASKKRPPVVISSQAYNAQRPDLIIMAITSVLPPALHVGDVIVLAQGTRHDPGTTRRVA